MAADTIRRLFFTPSVAVARLGGSSTPMAAFTWGPGDPQTIAETRIRPDWTLRVTANAGVAPTLPTEVVVRDGALLRPVAPFLELWARTGDGPPAGQTSVPVTTALLAANGVTEDDVAFTVTAMNLKAAHRTLNRALRFGTFPGVTVTATDHDPHVLRGESPPDVATPMIPRGRHIPLGTVQVLRPQSQPATPVFPPTIRLDVLRLRFTPATGLSYGPPQAASVQPRAVPPERTFLDPGAGWFGAQPRGIVVPGDTVDVNQQGTSLGVVDDTCDAVVAVALTVGGRELGAHANITVGPPHFAPDRRPFLSIADELNDREHDPARDASLTAQERAEWVEDLFERIFETVSLLDLDYLRDGQASALRNPRPTPIDGDGVDPANATPRAMGGRDRLRDPDIRIDGRTRAEPFPLSARARERHRSLSDVNQLVDWVLANPDRLLRLVRPPFTIDATGPIDNGTYRTVWDMRMPPFMAQSNRWPLTLSHWQYDLLKAWRDDLVAAGAPPAGPVPAPPAGGAPAPLSPEAEERRRQVLDVIGEEG